MKIDIHHFKVIWYFVKPHKIEALVVLLLMFVSGIAETLNIVALYPVMQYGLKVQGTNSMLSLFSKFAERFAGENMFLFSCVVLIIITSITVVLKFVYSYFLNRLVTQASKDTENKIFRTYLTADYDFFVKNQQGRLIHTGTIASLRVKALVFHFMRFINNLVNSLFLFSVLMMLTWQATLLLATVALAYGLFIKKIIRSIVIKCNEIVVEENRKRNVILNEFVNGVKSIKIFFTAQNWNDKYSNAVGKSNHYQFKILMARAFPEAFMRFILFVIIAGVGIFLSQKSPENLVLSIPLFGTFAMVAMRFFPAIQAVGIDLMAVSDCLPESKIVYELCVTNHKIIPDGNMALQSFNKEISFRNIWFKYDNMQKYLIRDLSFTAEKRKVTAIVGPSGSGKTTIINLLLRLYHPEKGHITIDGVNIFDYTNVTYLSKIGYVSQETFIFNDTIKENIRFGIENCTEEAIADAAMLSNAHEFIINMRESYNTVVGDAGVKLSGGQRQRIAIARAMLRKPEILILDEATSSLDNIAEKNVQTAINKISQNTTVLVIAHRLSTIQNADKIVVLKEGSVSEEGMHEELMRNNGSYYNLYTKEGAMV